MFTEKMIGVLVIYEIVFPCRADANYNISVLELHRGIVAITDTCNHRKRKNIRRARKSIIGLLVLYHHNVHLKYFRLGILWHLNSQVVEHPGT